jgi:hypothetical protein
LVFALLIPNVRERRNAETSEANPRNAEFK